MVLIIAGIMRVLDAIWAFGYHGAIPNNLKDALLGHSLKTYGWIWLFTGATLIVAGGLVLGPSERRPRTRVPERRRTSMRTSTPIPNGCAHCAPRARVHRAYARARHPRPRR